MEFLASLAAKGIFKIFGDIVVQPLLQAFLKAKDVDLEKFKTAAPSLEHAVVAVLDANVRFAQIQANYALSVLQWWPFRLILFVVLAVAASRMSLIMLDATLPKIFGYAAWDIDPIKGIYGAAEMQLILFFVVAKPVDTVVSGAIGILSRYLSK